MDWNNIIVTQYGRDFSVNVDGVDINGITHFEYRNNVEEFPSIYMEFICAGELELNIEKGVE